MKLFWSVLAQADLGRLYEFLARHDLDLADAVLDRLIAAPEKLIEFPRLGSRLSEFAGREVRELRVERYVVRYELAEVDVRILRIFHARENRL